MAFDTQEELVTLLVGKTIESVHIINAHDNYFSYNDGKTLTIDGGVELHFADFKLTMGWNDELELFDTTLKSLSEIIGSASVYSIDPGNFSGVCGQTIAQIESRWNFYHDLDENFEVIEKPNFVAEQLLIHFESGDTLQLATLIYNLGNQKINNPEFDLTGQVLVSYNELIPIASPPEA